MKTNNKGISLISQIIIIIAIIILATIVIFSGLDTPEKAQLSKVISDIDSVQTSADQAYSGLYTERALAGEVWTKGQLYESVATGIIDRNQLSGEGLVKISDSSLLTINLPKYEGRTWYISVKDLSPTVQTGSVVLSPGFESDGKTYSTLLDIQNRGELVGSNEDIDTNLKVTDLKITTDIEGTDIAGDSVLIGTSLYIYFKAMEGGKTVEISPSVPCEVTDNGIYEFILTKSTGEYEKYEVNVNNYVEHTLATDVKVGGYIEYIPDSAEYITDSEKTGYNSQTLKTAENTKWKVLYANKRTGEVLLTTDEPVNDGTYLKGIKGYLDGASELNKICEKLYSNKKLGITARSMTITDLNKACGVTNPASVYKDYGVGYAYYPAGTTFEEDNTTTINPSNGKTYINKVAKEIAKFYTSDGGGKEETVDGIKYRVPTEADGPVFVTRTYYIYAPIDFSMTVGRVLGSFGSSKSNWLASQAVGLTEDSANFNIRYASSEIVDANYLCSSYDNLEESYDSIRPIISLSSVKLKIVGGEGTEGSPLILQKK